ncbi:MULTISPECIES: LysR family transcriptional regulator [Clostridium]|uniref:LysR family transcriptional regulator n=1 Tax=Clostridium TaxID=1485 RepID=UPI00115A2E4B|nr:MULTISPECIES: LysR substrate-binding domain-containing protein [Clostridium]MBS5306685.1 LysR family transcriptional regulator [Clostridium sp.]MDB1931984.1 LysR substrate-binding domain-containing protein [Clostridium tertium]MDB1935609.1 LysR substrate-binding domain-containing protein [Clostridium tertium]MDB1944711.1 LysR substrate-binding domain-containing protein [Clostridium tertium]MDB1952107.1 LysR substrate-binding domain-containing protein [Clostridium tertium]
MVTKLDLYKVFCQVGKSKSFSKASKELYMTQPAVSQAIMQLEGELDIRLFNRTSKGVTLTNEGSLLYEYVNSAINLINVGEEKILEFKDLTIGELKIGVGDTISKYFLLPYLEEFHNRYPNLKFKIINGTTLELCALIKSGEIDIAICNLPIDDPSLEFITCGEVRDIFVCGEKYKGLTKKKISLEEMVKYPLIFLEPNSNSRKYVENFMLSNGIKISPEFELGSFDLLLEFAKINLGIACVVKEFSKDYLEQGLLYEVKVLEEIPSRSIGVCYLKSVSLSLASTKFVEILEG